MKLFFVVMIILAGCSSPKGRKAAGCTEETCLILLEQNERDAVACAVVMIGSGDETVLHARCRCPKTCVCWTDKKQDEFKFPRYKR